MKKLFFVILLTATNMGCQQKHETVTSKATCMQAQQAIEVAQYQQEVLDYQILVAATSPDGDAEAQQELRNVKAAMIMFDSIVKNPELDCSKYSQEGESNTP